MMRFLRLGFIRRKWNSRLVIEKNVYFVKEPMADKLTEIMAWKREEVTPRMRDVSLDELSTLNATLPSPPSFIFALRRPDQALAVIAEIKRKSPSAGEIAAGVDAPAQAARYQDAGADCLSVLTDTKFFGGSLTDLEGVTQSFKSRPPAVPCLRKDFMVHPIQVREAREAGASAILIIVRALTDDEIRWLYKSASAAGLDSLFEVHAEDELERAVAHQAKIIGVNNRDLAIFKTDIGLSEKLIPQFPPGVVALSESGIHTAADAARAKACGAHGVLVGESLMKSDDPAGLLKSFR